MWAESKCEYVEVDDMNDEQKLKHLIKEWINQITDKDLLLEIYSILKQIVKN